MTCNSCGDRCGERWNHPELYEDYYCAGCYVQLIDEMVEELLIDRDDAVKAAKRKSPKFPFMRWELK